MPWTAAAIGASGALGAGASLVGGGKASSAAKQAAQTQLQMYQQTQQTLAPWTMTGASVLPQFAAIATGSPTGGGPDYVSQAAGLAPGAITEQTLKQTPGYQWIKQQGLQSTQSAAAARGLGVSGAALKGAATYATGLADQTYAQQFQLQQQQFTNALALNQAQQGNLQNQYARLAGVAGLGESAGAMTGQLGTQAAGTAGLYQTQAGQASAAGTTNAANAVTQAGQNILGYNILQQALTQPNPTNPASPNYMVNNPAYTAGPAYPNAYTYNPAQAPGTPGGFG